jgi:mannose-6-phosphate isomerase-like protein (cupin superfamily)
LLIINPGDPANVSDHITLKNALSQIPEPGPRFAKLFSRSDIEVEIYAPIDHDLQSPHSRDELYFVISGTGYFRNGSERSVFGPGDLLYAKAGAVHRFEDFSENFATWVIFFGPEGGVTSDK